MGSEGLKIAWQGERNSEHQLVSASTSHSSLWFSVLRLKLRHTWFKLILIWILNWQSDWRLRSCAKQQPLNMILNADVWHQRSCCQWVPRALWILHRLCSASIIPSSLFCLCSWIFSVFYSLPLLRRLSTHLLWRLWRCHPKLREVNSIVGCVQQWLPLLSRLSVGWTLYWGSELLWMTAGTGQTWCWRCVFKLLNKERHVCVFFFF